MDQNYKTYDPPIMQSTHNAVEKDGAVVRGSLRYFDTLKTVKPKLARQVGGVVRRSHKYAHLFSSPTLAGPTESSKRGARVTD